MILLSNNVSSFITVSDNSTPKPSPRGYMNTEVKCRCMLIPPWEERLIILDSCHDGEEHINHPALVCMYNLKPDCLNKALCFD